MRPDSLRPDLFVVLRLLEGLWRNGNRLKRTQLQTAAGINYTRLETYLAWLESRELVARRVDGSGDVWMELTPRGHEALRFLAHGLREILGETGGPASRRSPRPGGSED